MNALLADAILVAHFAFVAFVVGSLPLIWIGAAAGWGWIRNRRFRLLHLAAILFVAAESIWGVMCPLTVWEDVLRGASDGKSFVARWLHRVLFYTLPEYVFIIVYCAFALAVAATYYWVPPRRRAITGPEGKTARTPRREEKLHRKDAKTPRRSS
jgi:polyferredoxin